MLGLVFNVYIKLISHSDFTCATDDFQKARKNVIFENCIKNLSFEKDQMFDVFLKCLDQFVAACILI